MVEGNRERERKRAKELLYGPLSPRPWDPVWAHTWLQGRPLPARTPPACKHIMVVENQKENRDRGSSVLGYRMERESE